MPRIISDELFAQVCRELGEFQSEMLDEFMYSTANVTDGKYEYDPNKGERFIYEEVADAQNHIR